VTHPEIVKRAVDYLLERGVRKSTATPGHYRLAWVLDLRTRPPHFQSLLVFNSVFVGLVLASCLPLLILLGSPPNEVRVLAPYTVFLALVLGLGMAIIYRASARWMELPSWGEFVAEADYDPEW
jgi:hypothetical protein